MRAVQISADAQAILLLCSTVALPRTGELKPLSRSEWNDLARTISTSPLARPGGLLELTTNQLQQQLGIDLALADRLTSLLSRGAQLVGAQRSVTRRCPMRPLARIP